MPVLEVAQWIVILILVALEALFAWTLTRHMDSYRSHRHLTDGKGGSEVYDDDGPVR